MGENLMQLLFHFFRLQVQFVAKFASVFVNGILAHFQNFSHFRIGKIGARQQANFGFRFI